MPSHPAAYYRGNRQFVVEQAADVPPGPGEVQIAVAYVGICGTDMHVFHGNMDARVGLNRIIGHEMSGTVAALGEGRERTCRRRSGRRASAAPVRHVSCLRERTQPHLPSSEVYRSRYRRRHAGDVGTYRPSRFMPCRTVSD
jgi:threonine dehydrogenase-like Zn-dependent dehydrogenase